MVAVRKASVSPQPWCWNPTTAQARLPAFTSSCQGTWLAPVSRCGAPTSEDAFAKFPFSKRMEIHAKSFFFSLWKHHPLVNMGQKPCHNKLPFEIDSVYSPLISLATWQAPFIHVVSWHFPMAPGRRSEVVRCTPAALHRPRRDALPPVLAFPATASVSQVKSQSGCGWARQTYIFFSSGCTSFLKTFPIDFHILNSFLPLVTI